MKTCTMFSFIHNYRNVVLTWNIDNHYLRHHSARASFCYTAKSVGNHESAAFYGKTRRSLFTSFDRRDAVDCVTHANKHHTRSAHQYFSTLPSLQHSSTSIQVQLQYNHCSDWNNNEKNRQRNQIYSWSPVHVHVCSIQEAAIMFSVGISGDWLWLRSRTEASSTDHLETSTKMR